MSVPNKSLDKNKRYAGVKANDFVNKTRTNEANRSAARPQGWANLGKINSRRIPPPANLPSLKSETGTNQPVFDPTTPINHGWTSNESQSPLNTTPNPTQQQLDSLPVNCSTPPPLLSDIDKARVPPTWSTITSGSNEQKPPPNLLGLNDFPRLATTQDRKSQQPDSTSSIQSPSFRPANLAIWKEGGGSRVQPISNDLSQMLPNNTGANPYQQQNMRMYPPQMWAYNPYTPVPLTMHQQRVNTLNDYKNPTILRNKDIDDLSKLTDNTWANASQEVNYEEKIRFSDDEDVEILDSNNKPRRMNSHVLKQKQQQQQHTRFIQDDEHLKQMQDNKNSELINTLTIAKQRRDEQERHLRSNKTYDEQLISTADDNKPIPGYQTRPLLTSNDQDSSSLWQTNREIPNTSRSRHDTANSQTFTMRSWSDQMDSFNYSSLHEKSGGRLENDDPSVSNKYSRSPSETSTHSHHDNDSRVTKSTKKVPSSSNKQQQQQQQQKSNFIQTKTSSNKPNKVDETNYYDNNNNQQLNSNDQWDNWDESTKQSTDTRYQQYSNDNRRRQQIHSDDLSTAQKPTRYNEQPNNRNKQSLTKTRNNDRQQTNSRSKQNPSSSNKNQSVDNKSSNNKSQPVWRPLSPDRPITDSIDPTPQEAISFKSQQQQQQQRTGLNEHKQRYQTSNSPIINTALIPPLMSVRSDVTTTAKLYKTSNHTGPSHYSQRNDFYNETNDDDYYDEDTGYYDSNLQTHQRYHQSNLHNRGYTALGSYGRYRRGGALRHQQQYTTYNTNNTSGISSAPTTSTGTRNKKNSTTRTSTNNKKANDSSEQSKPAVVDEIISPSVKKLSTTEELLITKPIETSVSSPPPPPPMEEVLTTTEIVKSNDNGNGISEHKSSIKNESETNVVLQAENESTKINKKNPISNSKRRTNKDQQTYHQDQRYQNQQPPRHRNNYARSMQEYEAMQMAATQNYYGTTRRSAHSGRNTHMHDLSSGYYYEHPQQHYNNRYNYSNEHYQQQQQQQQPARSTNKNSKRGGSSALNNRQQKQPIINGINNNNNIRHHSISDNDLKEGEEWETASESSTNMRNGHYDNNQQKNETKSMNRGRTPPKKSFSSQRPNARQIFKYTNA